MYYLLICLIWMPVICHAEWFTYDKAIYDAQQSNWPSAMSHLHTSLIDHPDDPSLLYDAGVVSYKSGNFKQAKDYFKHVIQSKKIEPQLLKQAYFNGGNAHVALSEYKEAIASYEQALKIDPADERVRHNLKKAQELLKQEQEKQKQQQEDQQKKDQSRDNQQKQNDQKKQSEKQQKNSNQQSGQGEDRKQDKPQQDKQQGEQEKQSSDQSGQSQRPNKGTDSKEESKQEPNKQSGADGSKQQKEGDQGKKPDHKSGDKSDKADGQRESEQRQQEDSQRKSAETKDAKSQEAEHNEQSEQHGPSPSEQAQSSEKASEKGITSNAQDMQAMDVQQGKKTVQKGVPEDKKIDKRLMWIMEEQEKRDAQYSKGLIKGVVDKQLVGKDGQHCW